MKFRPGDFIIEETDKEKLWIFVEYYDHCINEMGNLELEFPKKRILVTIVDKLVNDTDNQSIFDNHYETIIQALLPIVSDYSYKRVDKNRLHNIPVLSLNIDDTDICYYITEEYFDRLKEYNPDILEDHSIQEFNGIRFIIIDSIEFDDYLCSDFTDYLNNFIEL